MRISTAEIKMLIKECVRQGGMYTAPDFKEYIVANSGKDVTRGQISGAVSQLVDTKEIVRVGRGLFAKDMKGKPVYRFMEVRKAQDMIYSALKMLLFIAVRLYW